MGKVFRRMKFLDFVMILLIIIKVSVFYIVTDMTGIRFAASILTFTFIMLIIGSFLLSKNGVTTRTFGVVYLMISILMFADSMYFAYFNQLPSVLQLMQVKAMIVVDADTFSLALPPLNIILLLDVPFSIYYYSKLNKRVSNQDYIHARKMVRVLLAGVTFVILIGVVNPLNADALKIVNQSELMTYHLRDIYEQVINNDASYIESEADVESLLSELDERNDNVTSEFAALQGEFKDYNLVVVQVESLQQFVIGNEFEGVELTPNLNKLINDNSIYFDKYYQSIGRGNTSDAEFASNNSLYPVVSGGSYELYESNTFDGLPWILKDLGYVSKAYHGFEGDFWNREKAYVNQGFDDYISLEDLDMTEKVSFGLSDVSFYDQVLTSIEKDYNQSENPFHSFIISLSCHYPYRMPEEYQLISDETDERFDSLFANYLSGVTYSDYALGEFMNRVKQTEFYDNTIFVFYGDHYGLNCKEKMNNELMSDYLGRDYDYDEMLNIPLIIHIPGLDKYELTTSQISKAGGQVDLLPTLSYLMGFEKNEITFGHNLFSDEPGYMASVTYMMKGSFIKDDVIYEASPTEVFEEGRAWSLDTGEQYEIIDFLFEDFIKANRIVESSKFILDNNLIKR